jgi:Mn-dependent DtxR family transcriptional regulator
LNLRTIEDWGMTALALQESGEMYLEAIYVLSQQKSFVRSIDVSEYRNYSKPSVSRAIGILKDGGYVLMDKDGGLTLTEAGRAVAEKIYDRHTTLTRFLTLLGVDDEIAQEDACRIEHCISDESFFAVKNHTMRLEHEKD